MKLQSLSIGTFNLYNLNEPNLPIYSNKNGWTSDQYKLKIDWTGRIIRTLRPDVFGLQELWHAESLRRALTESDLAEAYDVVVPEDANGTRIVCAALVRKGLLVGEPQWIVNFPEAFKLHSSGDDPQTPSINVSIRSFSRPVLHFQIQPRDDHDPIHVYVCHFKSKAPTAVYREAWYKSNQDEYKHHSNNLGAAMSTIRRTAEASALRFLLTLQMKGTRTPVIVVGDINDGQHSNTANIITEQPRYLVGDSRGGGDNSFYTAQTLQEYRNTRDVYYTHIHNDIMESLDHILVSEEFYDNSKRRLWMFDGMTVNNDHLNTDDHATDGTNDHGVVCATFRYRPIKAEARAIVSG
ncbi:endonuclease/exonuclease/phosphatase family protein [Phreatobacter oligotrophus]|uniref:Endonuclease/exonuclease/phosphatase family protein n=1 Tax=Phreatobacter oligotrophus TaxID=1122261 RepID=A0A2T4YXQ7_9HYPH|nr:endonuclease/exonuclease/phosphatase family protein [Phreatobacter oligotrophus]PTM51133.1 endonuclease/exonuclease/phosphatase family protein [Phreatobacter oligotrophus]